MLHQFLLLLLHIGSLFIATTNSFSPNDTDHLALLAIKSEIQDDPQGALNSWNSSLHFCQWQGVTCGHLHERVTRLNLSSSGLVGSLSPYIGNMSFLRDILLYKNMLSDQIPQEIGHLHRLERLGLFENHFEGEIPANLSQCSKLRTISLGSNKLTGRIPQELSSLSKLETLSIYSNNLTGGIPPFIGNLTSLESFSIGQCRLGGSIPDVFQDLKNLIQVGFGENDLTGTIPPSFYNISTLSAISLTGNQLRGTLPTNIDLQLPNLQILELGSNLLAGPLPASIANCTDLQILEVGENNFNGKIATNFRKLQQLVVANLGRNSFGREELDDIEFLDSFSNCSNLVSLDISSNQLAGVLPNSLANFSTKLQELNFAQNSITGSLPSSVGNLKNLVSVAFAENKFTGTIPQSIGKLQNLGKLALSGNNFSGNIPDSIGNLSSLIEVYLEENILEGTIPESIGNCRNLISLTIFTNKLSGSIPKQLFDLSSLTIALDLGENYLSGPIPQEIGNLTSLYGLNLENNEFSSELPKSLGSCTSLEKLYLGGNFFRGVIPTTMASLTALQELDLSSNNFSGNIPTFLEQIPLKSLNLSYNNFEGEVLVKGIFANASAISVVGNNRLCGGMPELQLRKCRIAASKGRRKPSHTLIIAFSIVSTLVVLIMVSFLLIFCFRNNKRKGDASHSGLKESFLKVSYERLLKATDGFSSANLIGVGSFASVYRGVLDEGSEPVAVKVLNLQRQGGSKSFQAECEALRNIRHRNLVKIITSCSSLDFQGNDFKALVYEFMPNGSLERWLHSSPSTLTEQDDNQRLNLLQRINIAIDVACALDYLHHRCEKPIVHCDLKPSNILLDKDMAAHVGDFGLAKLLLSEIPNANESSSMGIRGTIGYAAPEYGFGSEVSTAGDVYSYGILLLEMVTGKRPTDPIFKEGLNLHNYASAALTDHVVEIVDNLLLKDDTGDVRTTESTSKPSTVAESYTKRERCLTQMVKVGVACSMESPEGRMVITNAIHELYSARDSFLGAPNGS